MDYSAKISEIRRMKKIPQWVIAEKLGITQSAYNKVEKGFTDISIKRLFEICEALEIKAIDIIFPEHAEIGSSENNFYGIQDQKYYKEIIASKDELIIELRKNAESSKQMCEEYKNLYIELKNRISLNELI